MIAEDRARLLGLQRARLQQVQAQILAIDRAILASVAEDMDERDAPAQPARPAKRQRATPFRYERDGRTERHDREPAFPTRPATKPGPEDVERANAYLARLGVPEALL